MTSQRAQFQICVFWNHIIFSVVQAKENHEALSSPQQSSLAGWRFMDHIMDYIILFDAYDVSTPSQTKGLPWQQFPCYPFYLFRGSFFSEVILKAFFSPLHNPHRTQCWHNCSDKFDPELWRQTSTPPPQCDCTRASPNGHWFLLTCEAPFPHFVSVCELCLCWLEGRSRRPVWE